MAKSDVTLLVTVSNTVLDSEPMNPNFPPSPMAAPAPAPGLAQLQAAVQGIVNVLGNVEPIVQELAAMPGQLHALQVAFGEFQEALGELRNRMDQIPMQLYNATANDETLIHYPPDIEPGDDLPQFKGQLRSLTVAQCNALINRLGIDPVPAHHNLRRRRQHIMEYLGCAMRA
ncbi:hypothetical protein BGW80DRAFT_1311198 [Lactifluus volemus]|nr:hypothetical protein BGW80DRAFT_1311198 [Lactifluus volemus]